MRLLSQTFRSQKLPISSPEVSKSSSSSTKVPTLTIKSEPETKKWCVYLIISSNPPIKTYVGVTLDFDRRLKQHNGEIKGGAKATRAGRPWICACKIHGFKNQSQGKKAGPYGQLGKLCQCTRQPVWWRTQCVGGLLLD
ncbi:structure-specific endonuclease subunit slx1 isoform X2 [Cucurbita maxima]|uniref:Structure-specific endonuclease subunit slx1 isoform X2 n=1 Tax=Cucurbita maxima TaxID=3661 RepID=A0A6J1J559_CUCMA|nr:structure-specific endonuclease subunit slx1 isoform X2 [Cucurbita maxima]